MKKVKDYYYHLAKEKNLSARSVFKLQEIDEKYHLIKKGMSIMDMGASPGSWTEYALQEVGSEGRIVAIDLKPLHKTLPPPVTFIEGDIFQLNQDNFPDPNMKFDLILSDMAPNTSGNKGLNHQQSLDLCHEVFKRCDLLLKRDKDVIVKVFQGEDLQAFILEEVKPRFKSYKLFKPKSSRKESVELFIIGFKFKGKTYRTG
ncbi:MAG: ribosomal RNA large subunit methyltransferase E [bacterium]|nr:MAG: ribosomal RNA large subunit methyltransferase E [bacterium]